MILYVYDACLSFCVCWWTWEFVLLGPCFLLSPWFLGFVWWLRKRGKIWKLYWILIWVVEYGVGFYWWCGVSWRRLVAAPRGVSFGHQSQSLCCREALWTMALTSWDNVLGKLYSHPMIGFVALFWHPFPLTLLSLTNHLWIRYLFLEWVGLESLWIGTCWGRIGGGGDYGLRKRVTGKIMQHWIYIVVLRWG